MAKLFSLLSLFVGISLQLSVNAHPSNLHSRHHSLARQISASIGDDGVSVSINTNDDSRLPDEYIATAWYPGWYGSRFTPEMIPWDKYNLMTFAFALTTNTSEMITLDADSQALLPKFVEQAQQHKVKALLSIGGWTGSQHFSSAVATDAGRTKFVAAVVGIAQKYKLDGIDFDWEYPGKQGIGCNEIDEVNDSANFLSFLQALRKDPAGSKLIISAAVGITPFAANGAPMKDVSAFAKYIDFIAIMNYDIWGSWSATVGPNAPLDDSCAPTQGGSAVSALKAWSDARFPTDQITLGVAAYGHTFHVEPSDAKESNGGLALYPKFDATKQPLGYGEDGSSAPDACGVSVGPSGLFDFSALMGAGFLNTNGTAASGIEYKFDDCSKTPFVYNETSKVMVSYDDAASFAAKGEFIVNSGLRGFAMWHVAGDSDSILVDSMNGALDSESSDDSDC